MSHLHAWRRRHYWFLVLFVLFVAFRLGAVLLFRPGGFIADASDYDFYQLWGQTVPMGYTTFENLWTAYPPLFPALMLPIFELSARVPAWVEPRLAFHVLFGAFLLLFEAGNLILIYRLGNRLHAGATATGTPTTRTPATGAGPGELAGHPLLPGLLPAVLYALMFAPVYTLLGWFEALPLFFLLLGLDWLLASRNVPHHPGWRDDDGRQASSEPPSRMGAVWWIGSAIAAALGFLVKLTPIVLVPIAVRWLGAKLSWQAARTEWFNRKSPGNLLRPALYVGIFAAVVVGVGLPLARFNLDLALSSFRINAIRPPWQSVWALLDGYFGYGLVPIDMRNLQGLAAGDQWQSRLPWGLITLAFVALYLWLYTRRYDWNHVRTPIAFTGVSLIWLLLYSKGWSPQFVVWVIAFLVLLTPNLRGVLLAVTLTALNVVEATVFLVLLPNEHWLLWGTVLLRTLLLVAIAAEWLGNIWPAAARGRTLTTWAARLGWAGMALALVAGVVATPRAAQAYWDRRTAEHRCAPALALLRQEAGGPTHIIATPQVDVWQDLFPWLRQAYDLRVLDGYDPNDRPAAEVIGDKLATVNRLPAATEGTGTTDGTGNGQGQPTPAVTDGNGATEFWWVETGTAPGQPWGEAMQRFAQRPGVTLLDDQQAGDCRLARVVVIPPGKPLATADVAGGPITLLAATTAATSAGATAATAAGATAGTAPGATPGTTGQTARTNALDVVLYWQAQAPVTGSYTVFTQAFDPGGTLVAQQDNLPVHGLAPTNTWQPGRVIRDPYRLALPPDAPPGRYTVHVGLYDAQAAPPNRRTLTLPGGTTPGGTSADHLTFYIDR